MSNLTADKINSAIREMTSGYEQYPLSDSAHYAALAALRECAERREGCEHCTGYKFHYSDERRATFNEDEIVVHATMIIALSFCPMCGRKLERSESHDKAD